MTNTANVPSWWIINSGQFIGSLRVTSRELEHLLDDVKPFWFHGMTVTSSVAPNGMVDIRVEFEGSDNTAKRVFLAVLAVKNLIDADLI